MSTKFTKVIVISVALVLALSSCSSEKSSSEKVDKKSQDTTTTRPAQEPVLKTQVILDELSKPWDIAFVDNKSFIFTEKNGTLNIFKNGSSKKITSIKDVKSEGEGGLLGLDLDSNFEKNRFLYVCFNSKSAKDVRVARYVFNEKNDTIGEEKIIVDGIPSKDSGRHSGCRIRSAKDGSLFIGTGDSANSKNPQSPTSLGGKILRVDREGKGIKGNLGNPFDDRIFNFGHRNVQGIALFDEPLDGVFGFSVEHGPDRDDEINLIRNGNFGWAPTGGYDESVPMTDTKKFPDAIPAIWSSGDPTIAPSGATLVSGENWGSYNGSMAVAVLKGQKLKIIKFDKNYSIVFDIDAITGFGRIRSVVQGPDGNLYFATDDESNGKIIKVTPKFSN